MMLVFGGSVVAQPASVITLSELQQRIDVEEAQIHIINFWATWCGPCIQELPFLEKITEKGDPNVKVTLVSLDLDLNPDPERVYRFVRQRNLRSEVVLLDEPDPNAWITDIHPSWSGALPATLIVNRLTGEKTFIDRALKEGELESYLAKRAR